MSFERLSRASRSFPVRIFLTVCLTLSMPALGAQPPTANPSQLQLSPQQVAQRVDTYYNRLHSLRADFTESYQGMGVRREERGTLLLRKPGEMRWNYADPPGKLFILDGKYGWFYTPGDAHAQRISAADLDDLRSPLRFLLGHTHLEKEFQSLSLSTGQSGLQLSGIPKGMENRVARVTISVASDGAIQSIAIEETDGAQTRFTFTGNQPNAPAPESDFVFHPPAGIPVVDGLPPI